MKLFLLELRKILRPVPLLIFAAFTAIFSYMMIAPSIGQLNNFHEPSDYVAVCADLIELCGPTLEPDELNPAIETLTERYTKELEAELAREPLFAEAGVTDYESFKAMDRKVNYANLSLENYYGFLDEEYQIHDYAPYDINEDYSLTEAEKKLDENYLFDMFAPTGGIAIKLRIVQNSLPEYYGNIVREMDYSAPEAAKERIAQIYNDGEIRNIRPPYFADFGYSLLAMVAIMLLGALCILIAPVITRDNMTKVTALQYSSKTGRKALRIQLAAMLVSATLIAVLEIGITLGAFIKAGAGAFLGSGMNSFFIYKYNWFAGTYGEYLIILAALITVVTLAAALLVFFFSKLCSHYISLLLSVVPLMAFLILAAYLLFSGTFDIIGDKGFRSPYQFIPIPFVEVYICGLLLLIGAIAAGILLRRQRRAEI
jgi:hypothetical protein